MSFRYRPLCFPMAAITIAVVAGLAPRPAVAQSQTSAQKPTLYYIPHTHWEGAVFKTREEYLEMGLPHILQALTLLKKYPNYRFTLDQVAYIRPFLERYPEERAAFLRFVKEGRLGIVGGMDVMPDDVKPGGELFIRQMQYGKGWCKEQLGIDVTTGWMLDTFGHHPQMPQLLKLAGYHSFWFCRGVPNNDLPSEFQWKGIDGTEIPAYWLPGFYGLFWGPPADPNGFNRFFVDRYNALNPHALPQERAGLAGVDVSEPEPHVPALIEQFNLQPNRPFNIKTAISSDFESAVAKRKTHPVLTGDFNPIFQGTYSSRAELKQETREIEQELLTAEKLQAITGWLGKDKTTDLMSGWEPVLFNQTHDLASGVMTDHVYLDVQKGYDFARKTAAAETQSDAAYLLSRVNTLGVGAPVVVFNPSGWERTDASEVSIGFTTQDVYAVRVTGPDNIAVPCSVVSADKNPNGSLLRATVLFTASRIPALGYKVYHVSPTIRTPIASKAAQLRQDAIENEFYRVIIDRATGAISSIIDKQTGWEALSGPANVVAEQEDKGDLWELYHGLDGAQFIAMTAKEAVPNTSTAKLSSDYKGVNGTFSYNPAFSEFTVSHPLGTGTFSTRIRLYAGVKRVDIQTEIVNNDKLVRYQALFPTSVNEAMGRNTQEIPFGSVERPHGIEYPAQYWADFSDDRHGVTLLNGGMPGNLVSDGTLILSLMRAHTIGGYGFGGGYEPGMTSDMGYELNRPLKFRYALVPHSGDWRASAVRDGMAFNQPLQVFKTDAHPGILPPVRSMLQISNPAVILTAFKVAPDGVCVVRAYESSGVASKGVALHINASVLAARECGLLETTGNPLPVANNTLKLDFRPFEIKTLRLKLHGLNADAVGSSGAGRITSTSPKDLTAPQMGLPK